MPQALEYLPPEAWRTSCFGGFGPLVIEQSLLTACRRGSGQRLCGADAIADLFIALMPGMLVIRHLYKPATAARLADGIVAFAGSGD